MELDFDRVMIPCLRTAANYVQRQELLQEVRLTDGMPDIGKVLTSYGQVLVRGKEWRSNSMSVSGGVMLWVLYGPEDGSNPQWIETWLPFQLQWDFTESERDGSIVVEPILQSVDARSVSARKFVVRADIAIKGIALIPDEIQVFEPRDVPEDVYLLRQTYPVLLPAEAGEKVLNIEETLVLPASAQELDRIICCSMRAELTDTKIVSDKAVFKGCALLHVLYQGQDHRLYAWDFDIPISQYVQLDKEHNTEGCMVPRIAVSELELVQGEDQKLLLKVGLICQYILYDTMQIQTVADAYSVHRQTTPEVNRLYLPSLLDRLEQTIQLEQTATADIEQVVDTVICVKDAGVIAESGTVTAELNGVFNTLYYGRDGQLACVTSGWQESWSGMADETVKTDLSVTVSGAPQAIKGSDGVLHRANVRVELLCTGGCGVPMVSAVALSETRQLDPNRPSMILRCADTCSLWDVAKQSGSTVELIKEANGISNDSAPGQMLLIPVV